MDIATAALIFAEKMMDSTYSAQWGPYDHHTMEEVVKGIVKVTSDPHMIETLIKIARWESGGWRRDVATCTHKGGYAKGVFQVYPIDNQERADVCSSDFSKQAAVAMSHVVSSVQQCKKMGFSGSNLVTVYTHGRCLVDKSGIARLHWGDGKSIQAIFDEATQKEVAENTR